MNKLSNESFVEFIFKRTQNLNLFIYFASSTFWKRTIFYETKCQSIIFPSRHQLPFYAFDWIRCFSSLFFHFVSIGFNFVEFRFWTNTVSWHYFFALRLLFVWNHLFHHITISTVYLFFKSSLPINFHHHRPIKPSANEFISFIFTQKHFMCFLAKMNLYTNFYENLMMIAYIKSMLEREKSDEMTTRVYYPHLKINY